MGQDRHSPRLLSLRPETKELRPKTVRTTTTFKAICELLNRVVSLLTISYCYIIHNTIRILKMKTHNTPSKVSVIDDLENNYL